MIKLKRETYTRSLELEALLREARPGRVHLALELQVRIVAVLCTSTVTR